MRTRLALLLAGGLALEVCFAGCRPDAELLAPAGPRDPFALRTAACLLPTARGAFLLVDSLSVTNGWCRLRFSGTCAGEPLPAGRFGRPGPGSANVLWRGDGPNASWQLSVAPIVVTVAGDPELLASLELTVFPARGREANVQLEARLSGDGPYLPPAADSTVGIAPLTWAGTDGPGVVALGPARSSDSVLALRGRASFDHPARWRFLLAGSSRGTHALRSLKHRSHEQCLRDADRAWRDVRRQAAVLELGDAEVESAVDDALLVLLGCTERAGGKLRSLGNPFQYRDTWIRDAARQVSALAQWGDGPTARELAEGLLEFQGPGGDFLSQAGQLDATGEALWALGEAFERGDRTELPARVAESVVRAWRWCEWQRALVGKWAPRFQGLMPPADPRDNELAAGYLFGTDAWTLAGYDAAATLLSRRVAPGVSDSVRAAAEAYRRALSVRLGVLRGIPASWSGPARDWGNLAALYPTEAVDAGVAARREILAPLLTGTATVGMASYGSPDSVHTYLGADLAVDALLLGRRDLWSGSLDALLEWRTGTGGGPEIFSHASRSFGSNLPPHATTAAALLCLIRQGLVSDGVGDTLRLTPGTRASWWAAGGSLLGCGSRWGRLDLHFSRTGNRVRWAWTPVPVWTELHLPPGTRLAGGLAPGLVHKDRLRLLAPPGTGNAEVTCADR